MQKKSLIENRRKCRLVVLTILAMLLALVPGMSHALTTNLEAKAFQKAMPDGTLVWMWGFAPLGGTPAVPGPRLTVIQPDTLTINLTNNLPVPISLVIPGQSIVPYPSKPYGRVMSFTTEVAPGATGTYTWAAPKAGTYLYQSGTNPAVQVQMGLYGALTVGSAAGFAYPGKDYAAEALLLFSEVDPFLHDAVVNGNYINIPPSVSVPVPGPQVTSTIDYRPQYFLINGEGHPNPIPVGGPFGVNQKTLVRMLNAGLRTHVPTFLGAYISLIAEDGKPYLHTKEQYAVNLPAGKTIDAIFTSSAPGDYSVFDRRLNTTNAGASPGGMIAKLTVGGAALPPVAYNDGYFTFKNVALNVGAPGVLGNDANPNAGTTMSAFLVPGSGPVNGTLTLNANGSFTYTPTPGTFGLDSFQYTARNNGVDSNVATVSITVINNDPPVAVNNTYSVNEDATLSVAAPGVLGNDTDANGDMLMAVLVSGPANGTLTLNMNGSFTYKGKANFNGTDTFTYKATDGMQDSNPATVTITVNAVNDAPVAGPDVATTTRNIAITINLVANDYDVDGFINPATVVITTPPNKGGTLVNNRNGTVRYTPRTNFGGTEVFYYKVRDNSGLLSNAAKVTVNVR